jgi:hypothetical protein
MIDHMVYIDDFRSAGYRAYISNLYGYTLVWADSEEHALKGLLRHPAIDLEKRETVSFLIDAVAADRIAIKRLSDNETKNVHVYQTMKLKT